MPSVPYLKLSAVANEGGGLTLFALNRDLTNEMSLEVTARGFAGLTVAEATTLHDDDLKAVNTRDAPERVKPSALSGVTVSADTIRATLPPASWNVIRLAA